MPWRDGRVSWRQAYLIVVVVGMSAVLLITRNIVACVITTAVGILSAVCAHMAVEADYRWRREHPEEESP